MVSPNLIKKNQEVKPAEINENAKRLFQVIYSDQNKKVVGDNDDTPKISVSTVISKVAFFYEKIRNVIDYDEDHLLRKNAIIRILKRQVVIEGAIKNVNVSDVSKHLITEMIRGGYLPNDKIPETKIAEVAKMLDKYIKLRNICVLKINSEMNIKKDVNRVKNLINEKNSLTDWILSLAACEIEESLGSNKVKQAMTANLYDFLSHNLKLPDDLNFQADLEIQTYLSICRTYQKFDNDMLSFVLFKYYNDNWTSENLSDDDIAKVAVVTRELKTETWRQLEHPLVKQMDRVTRKYALYSMVMAETIEPDPVKVYNEIYNNEKTFLALVKKVCNNKYKKAKSRLWRVAMRSIAYIFLTKSIFVFALEIPATQWFHEPLNPVSLAINVIFPAFLLFLIVFLTRTPGEANTDKIIKGVKELFFVGSERKSPIILRSKNRRGFLINWIFNIIYVGTFFVSIYFVIWALTKIHFNWVSIIIFLFFLAFVSFFSIITTKGVKDLIVVERRENLITLLLDLFYMPIILIGKWLSNNVSKVNIFIFVFDFIIEAPFKVLVEVADDWTRYVKERKDNM
ncbi:MAG: hypothetical protein WCK59_03350 [Candidatus Falkowbacteria bacterium]